MTEKQSTIERPTREQMLGFTERQLAALRPQIASLLTKFRDSVRLGSGADEESGRLFHELTLLRLVYSQLRCEAETFTSQGNGRWVSPDEATQFPPAQFAEAAPAKRQPMGFRKATEPSAD